MIRVSVPVIFPEMALLNAVNMLDGGLAVLSLLVRKAFTRSTLPCRERQIKANFWARQLDSQKGRQSCIDRTRTNPGRARGLEPALDRQARGFGGSTMGPKYCSIHNEQKGCTRHCLPSTNTYETMPNLDETTTSILNIPRPLETLRSLLPSRQDSHHQVPLTLAKTIMTAGRHTLYT